MNCSTKPSTGERARFRSDLSRRPSKRTYSAGRAAWLISHVFKRIREVKKALSDEALTDLNVQSYAAASAKIFINFSSSRAGTDDGRVSGEEQGELEFSHPLLITQNKFILTDIPLGTRKPERSAKLVD